MYAEEQSLSKSWQPLIAQLVESAFTKKVEESPTEYGELVAVKGNEGFVGAGAMVESAVEQSMIWVTWKLL